MLEKNISDVALYVMDLVTDSVIREVDISGEEKNVKPTIVPDKNGETDRLQDTERQGVSQPDVIPSPKPSTGVSPAPVQPTEPEKVSVPGVEKVKDVKVTAGKKKLILKWKKSSGRVLPESFFVYGLFALRIMAAASLTEYPLLPRILSSSTAKSSSRSFDIYYFPNSSK